MVKLRKQRKRKVYRASVNRKRLRNKISNNGVVKCPEIKKAWEYKRTAAKNLRNMGLVSNPNEIFKKSNVKEEILSRIASTSKFQVETTKKKVPYVPRKKYVAKLLENEANAPRERTFQLPSSQVEWLTYLMDKYGTDYKAMTRDSRNYYQETWKQIRAKIKVFMGIPEQYANYLESRGLSNQNMDNNANNLEESDGEL